MSKDSAKIEYQALAALMTELETQSSVGAIKGLMRAAFLFINSPDRASYAHGLSAAQVDVLAAIARAEEAGLNCSDIAERTLITKGGITKIVDRLEAGGLVKRIPSRKDRRNIRVQLSAKGVEFCRHFFPQIAIRDQQIFERAFRPDQIAQLSELLALLVRTLEAESRRR
jgi:DNA-binding MarR family transcriptional regulator